MEPKLFCIQCDQESCSKLACMNLGSKYGNQLQGLLTMNREYERSLSSFGQERQS